MDKELETVIKILNTKKNNIPVPSHSRSFRIRSTQLSQNSINNSKRSRKALEVKPVIENALQKKKETPIEDDMILDIQEFYKKEDEEYKKEVVSKTGAPIL